MFVTPLQDTPSSAILYVLTIIANTSIVHAGQEATINLTITCIVNMITKSSASSIRVIIRDHLDCSTLSAISVHEPGIMIRFAYIFHFPHALKDLSTTPTDSLGTHVMPHCMQDSCTDIFNSLGVSKIVSRLEEIQFRQIEIKEFFGGYT